MNNWVKLYSKFKDWKWYKNQNTKSLFIHCLLKANWKDSNFEGVEIKRGSFVTSLATLSEELNISVSALRVAIKHLILTQEIAQVKYPKFTVITVNNYDKYQAYSTDISNLIAGYEQRISKLIATIEEYKNNRNIYDERNNNARTRTREQIFDYDWLNDKEDHE